MADKKEGGHPAGVPGGPGAKSGSGHPAGIPGGPGAKSGGGHPAGIPGGPGATSGGGHPAGVPGGPGSAGQTISVDLSEKGASIDGKRQVLDRRIFVQLLVFEDSPNTSVLINALQDEAHFPAVLYRDMNNPNGLGLLTMSEDPDFFVNDLRHFLKKASFKNLTIRHEYTMLGRTYAIGHEQNLKDWLIDRTPRVTTNPEMKWAIWYPLRRKGSFAMLPPREQGEILMEHGMIGRAFGSAGLGSDIRLISNGLDQNDNDFVIGLIGKELFPLSALVQRMRSTKQTSTYIEEMGPFFVGRAIWQSSVKEEKKD